MTLGQTYTTPMTRKIALLVLAISAATVPAALAAMPPAEAWEIGPMVRGQNYSVGMPAHPKAGPNGSLAIDLPLAGAGQVDALTVEVGPLNGVRQITMHYRIDAAPGTRFVADEMPSEPATVSLYFQRAGDDWSGRGRYEAYRWYSPQQGVVPLTPGEHTVRVRLDEVWINVNGRPNDSEGAGFAAALADTARIGVAFGSSSRRSHGVYATGPARFTLLSLDLD